MPPIRVEYLDFRDVPEFREYRFRLMGSEGATELRARVARVAFDARLLRVSDGPDLCYQKLVRALAAGATPSLDAPLVIEDADLVAYRDEHAPAPRRRATNRPPVEEPAREEPPKRRYAPRPARPIAAAPPVAAPVVEAAFHVGQRVRHAVFGMGVTTASSELRTAVCFDEAGPRSFVTSMVELEVLSPPLTWETSSRGKNRLRGDASDAADPTA